MTNKSITSLFAGLLICLATSAHAQQTYGTILGLVTDASGAAVPGATIVVANVGTGFVKSFDTDSTGDYVFSNLVPGTYSITVHKEGYKTYMQTGVSLVIDQKARVNVKLSVGAVNETVTVTAAPPQVEVDSSEISTVIGSKQIVEAPLSNRSFGQLLSLAPGVLQANAGSGNIAGFTGAQINNPDNQMGVTGNYVNGFFGDANNFELDGVSNNEFTLGLIAVNPSIDGIAEFKLETNTYSAEFGRAGGADVEIATKSGTNNFHGDLFEFVRNDIFDAIPYDQGAAFVKRPEVPHHRENQFGGTIGGPIRKNHTFFFFDFERFSQRLPATSLLTLPTAQQLMGDFSQAGNNAIYNPFSCSGGTSVCNGTSSPDPFPGNVIPSGSGPCGPANSGPCISPAALNIAKLLQPFVAKEFSAPIGQPNFLGTASNSLDRNDIDTRVDHNLSDNDRFFVRFSYLQTTETVPHFLNSTLSGAPWLAFNGKTKNENAVVSEVHNFGPRTSNELRFGVSHIRLSWFGFNNSNTAASVGIPNVNNFCGTCTGLPYISLGGAFGAGYGDNSFHSIGHEPFTPTFRHEAVYQWVDDVTHVAGKQTVKVGLDVQRAQINLLQDFFPSGDFGFTRQITSNLSAAGTGDAWASFLLGLPSGNREGDSRTHHLTFPQGRSTRYAAYIQDDYKFRPNLTLNLGLRYEYYPPATDAGNNLANFDYSTGDILQACVATSCSGGVKTDKYNLAPRLGFAYSPDNGKTAIRGGFGVSYYYPGFIWDTLDGQYPHNVTQDINPVNNAFFTPGDPTLDGGLPPASTTFFQRPGAPAGHFVPYGAFGPSCNEATTNCPLVSMNLIDSKFNKTPRVYQWTLDLQRQLTPSMVLDTAYVGNHATDLYGKIGINIPELGVVTSTGLPLQKVRPLYNVDPQLSGVTDNIFSGQSWYDALQAKLDKRFSHGLQFLVSYTFSKTLERGPFGSGNNAPNQTGGNFYFDPYFPGQLKFITPYNRKHAITASYTYALPVGRNGIIGQNWGAIANYALGGWQLSGITTWTSGAPFTATGNSGSTDNGTPNLPSQVCKNANLSNPGRNHWFNSACFVNPATANGGWPNNVYGSEKPDNLVGPRFSDWDIGLHKNFPLWGSESRYLQFRAEAFDVFNHINFGDPTGSINTAPLTKGGAPNLKGDTGGGDVINTVVQQAGGLKARELQLALKLYF